MQDKTNILILSLAVKTAQLKWENNEYVTYELYTI